MYPTCSATKVLRATELQLFQFVTKAKSFCVSLRECLLTDFANILWFLSGVYSNVPRQVGWFREHFLANFANIWFPSTVNTNVHCRQSLSKNDFSQCSSSVCTNVSRHVAALSRLYKPDSFSPRCFLRSTEILRRFGEIMQQLDRVRSYHTNILLFIGRSNSSLEHVVNRKKS